MWFATAQNGIYKYDGKSVVHIAEKDELGKNFAGGIAQDKYGNMWFTIKEGICRYDGATFKEITAKDGFGGTDFWGIYIETSGIIWFTARGATIRYDPSVEAADPKAITAYTEKEGVNCCVQSMYQDRSGNMRWGAGSGVYRFNGRRFYQVKQRGPW